jgi:hypothetical protein
MKTYRIRGWAEHFESYECRRLVKALAWVATPTKHDGKTFRRVMRIDPSGALIGAWNLLVQVGAKCPIRGTLSDQDGPLTALDISDKTGLSVEAAAKAIEFFASDEIRWLEVVSDETSAGMPADSAATPATIAGTLSDNAGTAAQSTVAPRLQDSTEQNITSQNKDITRPKPGGGNAEAVQAVLAMWNKIEGVLHARSSTDKRVATIKARLADPNWRENWQAALERVRHSTFCRGGGDRSWKATFDWFINPDTLTKILEGQYDDQPNYSQKRTSNIGPGQKYKPGSKLEIL